MKNFIHSIIDPLRDRYTPVTSTSTFRATGQITPEEFLAAGDFLVYKFPSWSWSDAAPSKRVAYLPEGKQFLVTRGVPCHRRLDDNFTGDAGLDETVVQDGFARGAGGDAGGDDEGWLRTGGLAASQEARMKDVRTVDDSGNMGEKEDDDDEIPDMEDEDDDEEAIIRDSGAGTKAPLRSYTLYITYTPYYRTPRLYLSGYAATSEPLPPTAMLQDIAGDYNDKTVTLEEFPFFEAGAAIKMASVHPCRHASVMKSLLDRADAALVLRREKLQRGASSSNHNNNGDNKDGKATATATTTTTTTTTGLEDRMDALRVADRARELGGHKAGVAAAGGSGGDEWEVLQHEGGDGDGGDDDDTAIRVDQYLVVFLKFISSVTPTIEHDFTMGV